MKSKKWIDNYNSLNPNNQLEVAEAIVNKLKDNEKNFNDDEYDKENSKVVRELFNSIKNKINQSEELKKFNNVFNRYESLSPNNRKKVSNEIFKTIVKYLRIQKQDDKNKICEHEGHIFGKWKNIKWTEFVDTVIDHQYIDDYPIEHEEWFRTCTRCGFVERVEYEPEELFDERKEKEIKEKIKKLEQELKDLKNK